MPVVRRAVLLTLTTVLVLVGAVAPPASAQPPPPPNAMVSLGDSITRGFNACGFYLDCTSRSFSTGDAASVNSHYLRIRQVNPQIAGNNVNRSRSGAVVADLPAQAESAVAFGPEYVTVLIGANDACTRTEAAMTPVPQFRADVDAALAVLAAGAPDARILVISIPDLHQLWNVGRSNVLARSAWSLFNVCQSMLANPTSFAQADVERRDRVRERVIDYNAELAAACAAYGPQCRYDGDAVFQYPFSLAEVSGWDYFHPNRLGQEVLADVTYRAGFDW